MKKTSSTIVFFGSGPVASASLEFLAKNFTIEAVITKAKPPHHKSPAPVEILVKKLELPTFFANTKLELDEVLGQKKFSSPLGIIVDYGVIVSTKSINSFAKGIVNSHFSLLPEWRGADPISFSILSGQKETGVSLMAIVPELDEGQLLSQQTIPIKKSATNPELTEQLIDLSNRMLLHDLPLYLTGKIVPYDQTSTGISYSRKINKSDGILDWSKAAIQLDREVRAYIDWPKSRTTILKKEVIITKTSVSKINLTDAKPGELDINPMTGNIVVQTGSGCLCILGIKPVGKKEMTSAEFIRGYSSPA